MAEQFFPFDSVRDSQGKGDRVYKSKDWSNYFKNFISNGLMHINGDAGFDKTKIENLQVTLSSGGAFIEGKQYLLDTEKVLQFEAEPNMFRKDLVVIRLDDRVNARMINIQIVKGTPVVLERDAVAPSITRNDNVFDLGLYTVLVRPGATAIQEVDITDLRGNPDYSMLSNLKAFGGATLFVGEATPPAQFTKVGDIWMDEVRQ